MSSAQNYVLDIDSNAVDVEPARRDKAFHRETVTGVVERITFQNPKSGFCVLRVRLESQNHVATVVGHTPMIVVGEGIEARGGWVNDPLHGYQFRADWIGARPPATVEGLERYLSAGMIPGVGPVTAQRLIGAFGAEVFDVIERAPQRLCRVPGIGRVKAERIATAWAERQAVCEVIAFLHPYGIGVSRAVRIFQTYGRDAVRLVAENPYRLVRELGIGFSFADAIAAQHGFAPDAPERMQAALVHLLTEASRRGHCALPMDELLALGTERFGVARGGLEAALATEAADGELVVDALGGRDGVFLKRLHEAERLIAERLRRLAAAKPAWSVEAAEAALQRVDGAMTVPLGKAQREALRLTMQSKVTVITGGPGVGKTTLIGAIVAILRELGARPLLCASTARAARRLIDTTGVDAKTIHRLLGIDPLRGGARRAVEPLDADLVIVDEVSMVDIPLMAALLDALPDHAALVLVGDGDQLPSIGPGHLFADAIMSGVVPVARLTDVFRQNAQSAIVANAHRINHGEMPELAAGEELSDFYFVPGRGTADTIRKIVRIVQDRIPFRFGLDAVKDVQVLCPMNRGGLGARSLNFELQRALNPPVGRCIERFGWAFGVGDKVMQVENDYDRNVFNGELGVVAQVDEPRERVVVSFDNREIVYEAGDLDQITLAYATTIHKAQGSEYPAVVIPLTVQHRAMLHRSLVYTGITRARRLVVLVGEPDALQIAVDTVRDRRRWSKLKDWLLVS